MGSAKSIARQILYFFSESHRKSVFWIIILQVFVLFLHLSITKT